MTKESNTIEITHYTDYVSYLNDLVHHKREEGPFSFRLFCRRSGFRSPSYLKWVLDGVRPISLKSVHKFITGLVLDKREASYFVLMVNYKEAKDPQTKRLYYEQMLTWQQRRKNELTKDAYEYLSHWYYLAIRELVASKDFKEDPRWIRDRLEGNLTLWEIKNGFETLERLKLIRRDVHKRWQQTAKDLQTEAEVKSLAAYNYHLEMLDLAQKALTKRPPEERNYQSLVALVHPEALGALKAKMHEIQSDLIRFLDEEENKYKNQGTEELYAFNMHTWPLTVSRRRREL